MDVWKTYAFFSDHDQGFAQLLDTIAANGQLWIVGSWLQSNATGERIPEKLVLLDALPHQEAPPGKPYRFVLSNSLPRSVLQGKAQPGYVVATYQALVGGPGPSATKQ